MPRLLIFHLTIFRILCLMRISGIESFVVWKKPPKRESSHSWTSSFRRPLRSPGLTDRYKRQSNMVLHDPCFRPTILSLRCLYSSLSIQELLSCRRYQVQSWLPTGFMVHCHTDTTLFAGQSCRTFFIIASIYHVSAIWTIPWSGIPVLHWNTSCLVYSTFFWPPHLWKGIGTFHFWLSTYISIFFIISS